jgi:hypothetical protein
MMEGDRSVQNNDVSGSERSKTIRIRIHNTVYNFTDFKYIFGLFSNIIPPDLFRTLLHLKKKKLSGCVQFSWF